jgi:hypothetical protein
MGSLINARTVDNEPPDSQPFINGLDPVLVGSDWQLDTLRCAKFNDVVGLPALDPAPGGVARAGDTLFIPCGDRIPEFGDVRMEGGYTLPGPGYPGLDNNRTIIIIDDRVAYMNGAAQNGYTVLSTPNLINGFDYEISGGPGGKLPVGLGVTINVYLEGVESWQDSYDIDVEDPLILEIDQLFVVAKNVIKLTFNTSLAVTRSLLDPTTYSISSMGSTPVSTKSVLPIEDSTTTVVFLELAPTAAFGASYQLSIAEGAVFDSAGEIFQALAVSWVHHRTKTDSVVASLAGMYNTNLESNLRTILQAITISDEEIGGDF